MKTIQVGFAVLMILVFACPRRLRAGTAGSAAAITAATTSFTDAWNSSDGDGIARVFMKNGTLVIPDGTMLEGRSAIEAFYRDVFSRGYRGSRARSVVKRVSVLLSDVAIVDGEWSIEGAHTANGGLRSPEHGIFCAVLVHQNNSWRIAALREQTSATQVAPLPAAVLK